MRIARAPKPKLRIESYTSRAVAGMANSYLIFGEREALLFDVVQTRRDASQLADRITASRRRLTTIFISHAHPDHYLGLDVLASRFPRARVVALPEVVADIRRTGPALVTLLRERWGADGPTRLVVPAPLTGGGEPRLILEGAVLRVLGIEDAESEHLGMLLLPETGDLFCGDLVYNRFHLFLREKRVDGWLAALDRFEALAKAKGVMRLFPGHGKPGALPLIEANRRYLRDFRDALRSGRRADVETTLLAKYPDYAMPGFLTGFTLDAFFPAPNKENQ